MDLALSWTVILDRISSIVIEEARLEKIDLVKLHLCSKLLL